MTYKGSGDKTMLSRAQDGMEVNSQIKVAADFIREK
jgi:hypothetical protein